MGKSSVLAYLDDEILPQTEAEYELKGVFGPEELNEYNLHEDLLTEGTEQVRTYKMSYRGHDISLSAELGDFEGERSIGISARSTSRLQDEAVDELVQEISDFYETSRRTLGHGKYILEIEDW